MPFVVVSVPMLLSVLSAAATLPKNAPKSCIIYVDPCTADLNDNRLSLIQESCELAGVQVVRVWSAGYARMLCARPDTEADEAENRGTGRVYHPCICFTATTRMGPPELLQRVNGGSW